VPYERVTVNPVVPGVPSAELEKNTLKNYEFIFTRFQEAFGDRQIESISTDDVLAFLTNLSAAAKPATKRHATPASKPF
jgi:hypothetical protein